MDRHHIAGRANSSITLEVPVNDHRAYFSEAQRAWPKETLENRGANPYRKNAALLRGLSDLMDYVQHQLRSSAELLESVADSENKRKK
jgi:hypothetical protein